MFNILHIQLDNRHDASFEPPSDGIFRLDQSISETERGHQLKICMEYDYINNCIVNVLIIKQFITC